MTKHLEFSIYIHIPDILEGQVSILLGSPEIFSKWLEKLADDTFCAAKPCAFVIEEAHNIVDWTTFRPLYSNLADVKCIIASLVPWALFTATCDETLRTASLKSLKIDTISTIAVVPDRFVKFLTFIYYHLADA